MDILEHTDTLHIQNVAYVPLTLRFSFYLMVILVAQTFRRYADWFKISLAKVFYRYSRYKKTLVLSRISA